MIIPYASGRMRSRGLPEPTPSLRTYRLVGKDSSVRIRGILLILAVGGILSRTVFSPS